MAKYLLLLSFILTSCSIFDRHPANRFLAGHSSGCNKSVEKFFETTDDIEHLEGDDYKKYGLTGLEKVEVHFQVEGHEVVFEAFGELTIDDDHIPLGSFYGEFENGATDVLSISYIKVNPQAKRRGLQNLFYQKILERVPELKRIKMSFAETNATVLEKNLEKDLEEAGKLGNLIYNEAFKQLDESQQEYFIKRAIETTPAFKSRKKIGFGFCPESDSIKVINYNPLTVMFDSCRQ